MTETENLALWSQIEQSDPNYVKEIKLGYRTISSPDAYWQVKQLTTVLGPIGKKWGVECADVQYPPTDMVALKVRLHVEGFPLPIEQWGMASLYSDAAKKRPDNDAFKKAMTDGMTKTFSYLGCNADIFLGRFDDLKYVEALKAEATNVAPASVTADEVPLDRADATVGAREWGEWVEDQIAGFAEYKTLDDLEFWKSTQSQSLKELQQHDPGLLNKVQAAFKARKQECN